MAIDVNEFVAETVTSASYQEYRKVKVQFGRDFLPHPGFPIPHTHDETNDRGSVLELDMPPIPMAGPIALSLQPMELTAEEAEEMREFLAHGTAYPTIPTHTVPQGDRSLLKKRRQ